MIALLTVFVFAIARWAAEIGVWQMRCPIMVRMVIVTTVQTLVLCAHHIRAENVVAHDAG